MLKRHRPDGTEADSPDAGTVLWYELLDPQGTECTEAETALGFALPTREMLASVELSSRVALVGGNLRLNLPRYAHEGAPPSPLGLIVTPTCLVSIRYAAAPVFDALAEEIAAGTVPSSAALLGKLVELFVGEVADAVEDLTAEVDRLSARLFRRHQHGTRVLRSLLSRVGHTEGRLARLRLTASGLLRIVMFTLDNAPPWFDRHQLGRLKTAQKDLEILAELDAQLTDKLQFLLDAALGFISVEQNDVMKLFTVASVIAIPPVILAGIWGMNFHHMPELAGQYNYALALAAIVASMVLSALWFKRRGWF